MNRDMIKGHRKAVKDKLKQQQWYGVLDDYVDEAESFNEWETHFQHKANLQRKLWAAKRRKEGQIPTNYHKKNWSN